MAPSQSALTPGSLGSPMPTTKKFNWERPKLLRNTFSSNSKYSNANSHRVTFSESSKGSSEHNSNSHKSPNTSGHTSANENSHSDTSRPPSPPPPPTPARANEPWVTGDDESRPWKKIDRQSTVIFKSPPQSPAPREEERPFLVYQDAFLKLIGSEPAVSCLIHDKRAPYFHNSGIYNYKTSSLFITSAPNQDNSPNMAPSHHLNMTITKIDFFSPSDFNRDKVRTGDHVYMAKSGCAWRNGIVLCAQGTLKEPSALVFMDSKRPHRTSTLLTNFNGIPLNSPFAAIAHADGSIWFSDPHLHHTPNFRPRPRLPPMIYRFDPYNSDLRAMCSGIAHPTAMAFAPDYKALYVLDGIPPPTSQSAPVPLASTTPMLYAYTISCFGTNKSPFLTHKRLFAFTTSTPNSVTTDVKGNVYVGCEDGVHVFDVGGSLIGRITVSGGVTGLCFGKPGELWISGGERLWRAQLQQGLSGSVRANAV